MPGWGDGVGLGGSLTADCCVVLFLEFCCGSFCGWAGGRGGGRAGVGFEYSDKGLRAWFIKHC